MFDTKILIIEEDLTVCSAIKLLLKRQDYEVDSISYPKNALRNIERFDPDLILMNIEFGISVQEVLSIPGDASLILMTDLENIPQAMDGMKLGASTFISKKISETKLVATIQSQLALKESSTEKLTRMERMTLQHIIGKTPVFLDILGRIKQVAASGVNVLIEGESGTGKTLIAEAIFQKSSSSNLLMAIDDFDNQQLDEVDALFLKDIDELPLAQQEQFFQQQFSAANAVRLLSTTTKNLKGQVAKGKFREDLFYQINSIQISMPPLKERKDDIPILVNHFLGNLKKVFNRPELRINNFAIHWLQQQTFDGNIRQLKKLVERTALASFNDKIKVDDFKLEFQNTINSTPIFFPEIGELTQNQLEFLMLKQALTFCKGDEIAAARLLGRTII